MNASVNANVAPPTTRQPFAIHDTIAIGGLVVMGLVLGCGAILSRPDLTANEAFLFADPALNLVVAEHMLDGERLYVDAAFQYGPLSILAYAGFAALAGNTPRSYLAFLLAWSVVCVVLSYVVLRTRVSVANAVTVVAGGVLATILIPGALAGALLSSTYIPMERALLLALAIAWRPPAIRTTKGAAILGLLLGVWQGVRFGAAVFAGLAILLVDVLAMALAGATRPTLRHWLRTNLTTLACFLAVEAALLVYAFTTLPRDAAIDLVWPIYILDSYLIAPPGTRWVVWSGMRYFVGQLLIPLTGLVATVTVVAWVAWTSRRPARYRVNPSLLADDLRLVVPAMFFVVGTAFYFRTVWHFQQFFWTLVLPVGLLLAQWGWRARGPFLMLAAPGLALIAKVMLISPIPANVVALPTPRGDTLWVDRAVPERVARIVAAARAGPAVSQAPEGSAGAALFIIPMGTGVHHFYGVDLPTRQSWFIPGFGRPADEERMLQILKSRPAVVVVTDHAALPGADPCGWYDAPHFRTGFCGPLGSVLGNPERLDETTWLFRNSPPSPPARTPD